MKDTGRLTADLLIRLLQLEFFIPLNPFVLYMNVIEG